MLEPDLEDMLVCLDDLLHFVQADDNENRIDRLTPNNGCAGDLATNTGSGFGVVI